MHTRHHVLNVAAYGRDWYACNRRDVTTAQYPGKMKQQSTDVAAFLGVHDKWFPAMPFVVDPLH